MTTLETMVCCCDSLPQGIRASGSAKPASRRLLTKSNSVEDSWRRSLPFGSSSRRSLWSRSGRDGSRLRARRSFPPAAAHRGEGLSADTDTCVQNWALKLNSYSIVENFLEYDSNSAHTQTSDSGTPPTPRPPKTTCPVRLTGHCRVNISPRASFECPLTSLPPCLGR